MNCLLELEILCKTSNIREYLNNNPIQSGYDGRDIISINTKEGFRYVAQGFYIDQFIKCPYSCYYAEPFFPSMKLNTKRMRRHSIKSLYKKEMREGVEVVNRCRSPRKKFYNDLNIFEIDKKIYDKYIAEQSDDY